MWFIAEKPTTTDAITTDEPSGTLEPSRPSSPKHGEAGAEQPFFNPSWPSLSASVTESRQGEDSLNVNEAEQTSTGRLQSYLSANESSYSNAPRESISKSPSPLPMNQISLLESEGRQNDYAGE